MLSSANATADPSGDDGVRAYPVSWRVIAGVLVAVSRASLPVIGVGVAFVANEPVTLPLLVQALVVFALLPGLAARLIERAFRADVELRGTELVVSGRDLRIEIPCAAIADVTPWTVPLPGPGFSLWMRSGRRLGYGLQAADPTPLLSSLGDVTAIAAVRRATRHPVLVYAHARRSVASRRWYHRLAKFVAFALVPTAVWFNAHQHITYGGLLGQYYLEGLLPYLKTFGISWGLVSIYLLLYASVWRGLAEGVALVTAWVAPASADGVRRGVEIACQVVYYGGVPVIVLVPFLR